MTERGTVLVVEDEESLRRVLRDNLEIEGYSVLEASDGSRAVELASSERPDLVIMDIMMPRMDGIEATRHLRQHGLWMPVVFLSARGDEIDRVLGLEIGGDDYITKPFSIRELLARIKVILRRARGGTRSARHTVGEREVDLDTYAVITPDGTRLSLSYREARLLELLLNERNKPLDRAHIMDQVWGIEAYPTDRVVDNTIVRLRKKLEPEPGKPRHLITVHGVGYKLVD